MARTIGTPHPDGADRRALARTRRDSLGQLSDRRGSGVTMANGEETAFGLGFAANYHKGLPHAVDGSVHCPSYHALVRMLSGQETGAVETLPMGANRRGAGTIEDPPRFSDTGGGPLGYRKLTSPFTGHVFDLEGADAAAFAIGSAPRLDTDELAAEMAELYAMALLRDVPFTEIEDGTGTDVATVVQALGGMPWFDGTFQPKNEAERRRFEVRGIIQTGADLFRGSTAGSKAGPWLSQYMLAGNGNSAFTFTPGQPNPPQPGFRGTRAPIGHEDGFVLFGTQIVDQRSIVATEGVDFMTNWAAWLDCQNGVDFNGFDIFRSRRRYLTTPRDIATYVHYDALYQAYLVACLLMLGEGGGAFPKDPGLPETSSRTRAAFASFGGPHILSLVTEVATRALKAVWRQKWLHHRRARPEVMAAWLTLHDNDPGRIEDSSLEAALASLRAKLPQSLLIAIDTHNAAQNATSVIQPSANLPADFPAIAAGQNFLLPMAFPEGSPTHPAYGAGHATVAGACVTILKAFFDMFEADGETERAWPLPVFVAEFNGGSGGNAVEGGELVPAPGTPALTIQGELDKLAGNISIARNMAGVHFSTDYYESVRLGERIAVSILEEQLSLYGETVSMSFTSFDGDRVRVVGSGGKAEVNVYTGGERVPAEYWYARYED